MNIFKLFFCSLCVLSDLIPMKEASKISLVQSIVRDNNNQNKKDNNNKKNLFRGLGYGTFTGLSLVGLKYKFPVSFEGSSGGLSKMMTGNYKRLFLTGLLTGAGLYTATSWIIQKLKTDHKNKNDDHSNSQIPFSESNFPLKKIDEKPILKTAKILLMMPGYFQGYIESIEETIFKSSFFDVCNKLAPVDLTSFSKILLWRGSREKAYRLNITNYTKDSELLARVFVMPDTKEIREEFEKLVKAEHDGDALDRYCDEKNKEYENKKDVLDCCYILPIKKEDLISIDRDKLQDKLTIDHCRFGLDQKIDKTVSEIIGVDFNNYVNPL